jgi:hypothetical protein
MDETDDEESQTLAELMDEETLRGDYFEGGVFLLLDEIYTIDRNGNGEYRVYAGFGCFDTTPAQLSSLTEDLSALALLTEISPACSVRYRLSHIGVISACAE